MYAQAEIVVLKLLLRLQQLQSVAVLALLQFLRTRQNAHRPKNIWLRLGTIVVSHDSSSNSTKLVFVLVRLLELMLALALVARHLLLRFLQIQSVGRLCPLPTDPAAYRPFPPFASS